MNAKVQRVLCCLLALVLTVSLFSAIPAAAAEPATIASESRSGAVQVQQPANAQLIAATSYQLVPGVTETQVILNQKEKEAQVAGFWRRSRRMRMWHSAHPMPDTIRRTARLPAAKRPQRI